MRLTFEENNQAIVQRLVCPRVSNSTPFQFPWFRVVLFILGGRVWFDHLLPHFQNIWPRYSNHGYPGLSGRRRKRVYGPPLCIGQSKVSSGPNARMRVPWPGERVAAVKPNTTTTTDFERSEAVPGTPNLQCRIS